MYLPDKFLQTMQAVLGAEFDDFKKSYHKERMYGLRVNTRKISCEEFEKICPFTIERIPWISNGYFYKEAGHPAKHPYYHAGLYYLQEPSAMTPASRMPIEPGETVLDLCAAPGGKATELGVKLKGKGLLVANDISNSRSMGLLKNLELFGIPNIFVLSETPEKLLTQFEGFFDKILVDAPCSGEGMFRKEPSMIKNWELHGVSYYAKLQREIVSTAVKMLKPGGMLLYSTCTFSPEEDEKIIQYILENNQDMGLQEMQSYEGFEQGLSRFSDENLELKKCIRIWPHKMPGDGHFLALLKKEVTVKADKKESSFHRNSYNQKIEDVYLKEFFEEVSLRIDWERVEIKADKVYYLPENAQRLSGMRFLRTGLCLGELKKKRFEPSQALALTLKEEQYHSVISFSIEDERVIRYLKGESIQAADIPTKRDTGWQLICVDHYPLGWGKLLDGRIKNKYQVGWRWQ